MIKIRMPPKVGKVGCVGGQKKKAQNLKKKRIWGGGAHKESSPAGCKILCTRKTSRKVEWGFFGFGEKKCRERGEQEKKLIKGDVHVFGS